MTARTLHTFSVRLQLRAPWLVHGNDPGRLGLDAVQLLADDGQGRLLPGSLVIGRVRDAWRSWRRLGMSGVPDPEDWLGPNADADALEDAQPGQTRPVLREPRRARVVPADLHEVRTNTASAAEPATRVAIDDATGAGKEGMLFTVEQREPPAALIMFEGDWRVWASADEAEMLRNAIGKALRWQSQLGALRSVGFGELCDVQIDKRPNARVAPQPAAMQDFVLGTAGKPRGIALRFDRPLVIASRRVNGNLYSSSEVVPGAALKAAMAHALRMSGRPIPPWFDRLRVTHAFPAAGASRPLPLPLSLVSGSGADGRPCIWDACFETGPVLDARGSAAAFAVDWKPAAEAMANAACGWGPVRRQLRVRTAIEDGRAKHSALFAYESVAPALIDKGTNNAACATHWVATMDLPAEHDNPSAWTEIADILTLGDLGPVGKTDAFAQVALRPAVEPVWPSALEHSIAHVRLQLVTPALLAPTTAHVRCQGQGAPGLAQLYQHALTQAMAAVEPEAAGSIELHTCFAAQEMAGGAYLHRRFMQGRAYSPYILTMPGSVFVLRLRDPQRAWPVLRHWQAHGLPLGQDVVAERGAHWQHNPYLPENGYGEVAINPMFPFPQAPKTATAQEMQP